MTTGALLLTVTWTTLAVFAAVLHYSYAVRLQRTAKSARALGVNGALGIGARILVLNQLTRSLKMFLLVCTGVTALFFPAAHVAGWFLIPLPLVSIVGNYFDLRYQHRLSQVQREIYGK